jgi:hypothetical protein
LAQHTSRLGLTQHESQFTPSGIGFLEIFASNAHVNSHVPVVAKDCLARARQRAVAALKKCRLGLFLHQRAMTVTMMTSDTPERATERQSYTGKEHKWARDPLTRINGDLQSLTPTFVHLLTTILINRSAAGQSAYQWLNANYTPFQINAWWTFGITSVVYWIGGLVFMTVDLTERPRWVYKYKLQPSQKASGQQYRRVCWIVLRNQVRLAFLAFAYERP